MIEGHQEELQHRVGCPVHIEKVLVQSLNKERLVPINRSLLTDQVDDIVNNPNVDIVIEVMGGIEETKKYILQALKNKKHVVTANKDLMALYGGELLEAALENGCDLFYEASVAGGIPIIRSLVDGLASDRIKKLMGIVNGTTNYILTKMDQEGRDYNDVLQEAQALGFAEADPTSDVEGLDAARKMAILSTLGFSMKINLEDVSVEGISGVTREDIEYGNQFGYKMKLVGLAQKDNGKVEVSVGPTFIPKSHPLASVNNEYNAVYVYGEAVGETMFYGPGAGQLPTATAVVSDLVASIQNMRLGVNGKHSITPQFDKSLKSPEEMKSKFFYRIHVKDEQGALSQITTLFAEYNLSLKQLLQNQLPKEGLAEIVIITHQASKKDDEAVYNRLRDLSVVHEIKSHYRVEGE